VAWDSVPGASSYLVEVAPLSSSCAWGTSGSWRVTTSNPYWTPLGSGWNQVQPYPVPQLQTASDFTSLVLDQEYCVRVRARGERDSALQEVFGDFTNLDDGTGAAFQWTGYPVGAPCTPSCNPNYLGSD